MFCPKCGKELRDSAEYCSYCGQAILATKDENQSTQIPRSEIKAVKKDSVKFWDKTLNRKQFALVTIVLVSILSTLRSTVSVDAMGAFYAGIAAWYAIVLFAARLRCNHIGTSSNTFICVCIFLFIPILAYLSWGYLLFKKGGSGYADY